MTNLSPTIDTLSAPVKRDRTITSLPLLSLCSSRQDFIDYFNNSWALTEVLFSGLVGEDAFRRRPYHKLRHPMIFYYGHPVVVYVNKLRVAGLLDGPINARFESIFEIGVDEMRWDDLHESDQYIWPSVQDVRDYRQRAYNIILKLIETHESLGPEQLPITQESPMWALVMGFEHERIHLETSSVLMRELPIECVKRPAEWPQSLPSKSTSTAKNYPKNQQISVKACTVSLGKPHDWPSFGWDNEYGSERRYVRPFSASSNLISNGEFLEFVADGGYANEEHWSREGLAWRRFRHTRWPTFWVQDGPSGSSLFKLRTIFEIIDMPLDWPVCVNFHEAKAYCSWRTHIDKNNTPYRLLTEAEHNAIRSPATRDIALSVGRDAVMAKGAGGQFNHNLSSGSESPVDAMPANEAGFRDVFGNVWQWCEDHFHPLSSAKPHPYYDDFSTPCYDGEHQMILGGSFISTGDLASIWARFHFRPHFFQHSGFRIARNEDANPACDARQLHKNGVSSYSSPDMLNNYMLMHWGSDSDVSSGPLTAISAPPSGVNLPQKCTELVYKFSKEKNRALELGCAVGRATFELAREFSQVVGIDYSGEFMEKVTQLQSQGHAHYWRRSSGDLGDTLHAHVDPSIERSRVRFERADICALPLHLKDFDAVLMSNALCRLNDPRAALERMQGANALVRSGGVLVLTTPFSWLDYYTPKQNWLNGLDDIKAILSDFELVHQEDLPFLLREHERKFDYIITLASVWLRK